MKKLAAAAGAVLALFLLAAAVISFIGLRDHAATADVIVVPGNTVQANGQPSARLQARLEAAISLYNERRAPVIFVSGGTGREGFDEAAVMARYLVARGIPAAAVVQDPQGTTTAATAANLAALAPARKWSTAIVATQYFHVARTRLALERQGVRVTGTRHARYFEPRDAYSLAREVLACALYFVKA